MALAGSDTDEKLAASRDSGLWPLLSYFEGLISDYVISDFSEKYVFRWTGLDQDDAEKREERARLVMTVNEMRAQERLPPLEGDFGDAPLNPSLTGVWMQLKQQEQPQDFGQPPGGPPGGEDEQGDEGGGDESDDQAEGGQESPENQGDEAAESSNGAAAGGFDSRPADAGEQQFGKGGQPGADGLVHKVITDKNGRRVSHWVRQDSSVGGRFSKSGDRPNDPILIDGSPDIWTVPRDVESRTNGAFPSAPVRLKNGVHRGVNRGFGVVHIEAEHAAEIEALGLTVPEYVQTILGGATKVYDPGNGRLLVVNEKFPGRHQAIIELRDDGDHYSVVTAFSRRPEGKIVWSGRSSLAGHPGAVAPSATGKTESVDSTPAVESSADSSAFRDDGKPQGATPKPSPSSRIAGQTNGTLSDDPDEDNLKSHSIDSVATTSDEASTFGPITKAIGMPPVIRLTLPGVDDEVSE